jgi:formamidopyrimidine-DNA glycosylase
MPELPEVQTIVLKLQPALRRAVLESVIIRRAAVIRHGARRLKAGLPGRRIERIDREGKWIIFRLKPAAEMVIHLGMTGRLLVTQNAAQVAKHTHLRFRFSGRTAELRFCDPRRFGGVWFFDGHETEEARRMRRLGPDALSIRVPELRAICRRRRQIKALLLDQQAISGMGNIYCDEALFATRIHPLTKASDLSEQQVRSLACNIRKTLRRAIESGGSTLRDYRQPDGSEGQFMELRAVYGREGEPCRRCGTILLRIQAAGRSSHICPACQKQGTPHRGC